jgi:hypothetical protein
MAESARVWTITLGNPAWRWWAKSAGRRALKEQWLSA